MCCKVRCARRSLGEDIGEDIVLGEEQVPVEEQGQAAARDPVVDRVQVEEAGLQEQIDLVASDGLHPTVQASHE